MRVVAMAAAVLAGAPAFARAGEPSPDGQPMAAGYRGGLVYLRAFDDALRLYPGLAARFDGTWAPVPDDLDPALGAEAAEPRLSLRRLRLELSGELARVVSFTGGVELGGGRVGDAPYVGAATPRWSPRDAHDGASRPAEVTISLRPWPWLALTVGHVNVPFSLSNRTREAVTPYLERELAIRAFAVPYERTLGAMVWGETARRELAYELGAFSGAEDETLFAGSVDGVGRVFVRPLVHAGEGEIFALAQLGVSGRLGVRDPERVSSDYPTIATSQGFVLWQPGHVDGLGRVVRVLPSGTQRAIGGELRLPVRTPTNAIFDLRGEAYYLHNDTREAVAGFEATHTERLGRVEGLGWYASLAWWACFIPGFDQLVTGEPGVVRPPSLDEARTPTLASALEASFLAGGIHGHYAPAGREGAADGLPRDSLTLYQIGGAIQFWYGAHLRATVEYMAYLAPASGDAATTTVVVPDNLPRSAGSRGDGHTHHELTLRVAASL
jgi:hypothetical protein